MRSISVPCGTSSTSISPAIIFFCVSGFEADVAGDRLLHEPGADQLADAHAGHRVVVGDHRQIALALAHELVDQALGRADAHEAADHEGGAVGDQRHRLLQGNGLHADSSRVTLVLLRVRAQ